MEERIRVNRPALGGTVPNSTTMSRRPALTNPLSRFYGFGWYVPLPGVYKMSRYPLHLFVNVFRSQGFFLVHA